MTGLKMPTGAAAGKDLTSDDESGTGTWRNDGLTLSFSVSGNSPQAWKREEFPQQRFSDREQVGLIAQEVREIVPEVVTEGADGYYQIDYGRLTPVLIQAIKEQQREIDELKKLVAELAKK